MSIWATIHAVTFDKSGTLTYGEPTVTDVVALDGQEQELFAIAAALEHYFE